MYRCLYLSMALATAACATAGEVVARIDWDESAPEESCPAARMIAGEGEAAERVLAVESEGPDGVECTLLEIQEPGISKTTYALVGRVRSEKVEGGGYLEMLSHFSGRGPFFSRGVEGGGPARHLEGSQQWRTFVLPFHIVERPETDRPEKIELGVELPGRGRVLLGPVRLVEYPPGTDPIVAEGGAWFPGWLGGALGGILGGLLGIAGAIAGLLAARGRGRRFVVGTFAAAIALGLALAAVGIAAWILDQPWGVYYPLMLSGGIIAVVSAGVLPGVKRRFKETKPPDRGASNE
ncbi:MAG: hypothetical protein R6V85_05385 [Polyangia bacterium]